MGTLKISPESLRASSNGMVGVVDRLSAELTTMENTLNGYGSPWGTGLLGSVIGQLYQEVHDIALGTFEENGEVVSEYAEGLDTMADEFEATEEEIEGGLKGAATEVSTSFPGSR
jgi:hypothetical protein